MNKKQIDNLLKNCDQYIRIKRLLRLLEQKAIREQKEQKRTNYTSKYFIVK